MTTIQRGRACRVLVRAVAVAAWAGSLATGARAEEAASPTLQFPSRVDVPAPATTGPAPTRMLEAYASHSSLSNGFPSWHETGVRGLYETGAHLLQGELASMRRWNENGVFLGLGDRYVINEDWYTFFSAGAGDGASYLPRLRADAFLHRKLLEHRNLVATVGAGYYHAPDGHVDRNVSLGGIYYFASHPLVVQGEVRFTHGSPGSVKTRQQFLAATWGAVQRTTVTVRYAWGREAYQSIGDDAVLVDFPSHEASVRLRHWLGKSWGVEAAAERYHNPSYHRDGVTLRVFWQP